MAASKSSPKSSGRDSTLGGTITDRSFPPAGAGVGSISPAVGDSTSLAVTGMVGSLDSSGLPGKDGDSLPPGGAELVGSMEGSESAASAGESFSPAGAE